MRILKVFYSILFTGVVITACQKDALDVIEDIPEPNQEFTVPDVPSEIAQMMSDEDLALFKAGPGDDYIQRSEFRNARRSHGRWHPVLMRLGYHLQMVPIGGTSCEPGQFQPCFGPGSSGDPNECLASVVGAAGMTVADGYWFFKPVHSEYYPVFCLDDYSGYGQGFYQVNDDLLWLEAQNGPFNYDEEGNITFCRRGHYVPGESSGKFSGAMGWEVMISYTAAENDPGTHMGIGYSDVIIFGWVYW